MRGFPWLIAALALVVVGCRDGVLPVAHPSGPGPAFATSSAALTAIGPGWRTSPEDPHACFTSVARPGGGRFRYNRLSLRFPTAAVAGDGAVAAFRFRAQREDDSVVAVLNCVVPATSRAREMVARRFHVPDDPGADGVTVLSCPTSGCDLPELKWGACKGGPAYGEYPDCDPYDACDSGLIDCQPTGGSAPEGTEGTDGCANCGPEQPTVACTPALVTRGSTVKCAVMVGSRQVGDQSVVSWHFTDGDSYVNGNGGRSDWSGVAVGSGTITASLADGSSVTGELTVEPRGWTWATDAWSEFSSGTGTPYLDHTPTYSPSIGPAPVVGVANGVNLGMGWTNCETTERQIQPDSYPPAGDGFIAATAASGPNRGMHYIQSANLRLRRESTLNLGMFPYAPRVALAGEQLTQCGTPDNGFSANWNEFSRCMGADPDGYITGARAHEGYGTTGHNGHFSAAYDAMLNPINDPLVFLDGEVSSPGISMSNFLEAVRTRFRPRAREADNATRDIARGGSIVTGNWSGTYWG
ncbi:MAG TPA: hypothetical protein VF625_18885, partial [Longimicrobium sp.]